MTTLTSAFRSKLFGGQERLRRNWAGLGLKAKLGWIAGFALVPALCLLGLLLYYDGRDAWRLSERRQGLAALAMASSFQGELEARLELYRRSTADPGLGGLEAAWGGLRGRVLRWRGQAMDDALERLDGDWQSAKESDSKDGREVALRSLRDDLPRLDQRLYEASRLSRDESLARLGLARALGTSLPALEAQLSRLRDLERDAAVQRRVSEADRRALTLLQTVFSERMAAALEDLESAFADEPGLKASLIDDFGESPFGLFQISADRYAEAVQKSFDQGGFDPALRDYCSTRYGQLMQARHGLYARLLDLVEARLRRHGWVLLGEVGLLSLLTGALFALSLGLARRAALGVLEPLQRIGMASRKVATDGDLSVRVSEEGGDELALLARDFNAMVKGLAQASEGVDSSALALRRAAEALDQAVDEQQASAAQQAAALHQALVTSEEIRQTSKAASQRAKRVQDQALEARASSLQGADALAEGQSEMLAMAGAVQDLRGQLAALPEKLGRVEAVADSVKELAVQTNVLALNAAIEALRAGEQGRSFGLVAREMRALADRSAEESQRVAILLAELGTAARGAAQGAVSGGQKLEHGLQRLSEGNRSLHELAQAVEGGAELASQIAEAVREQGLGLDQLLAALADQEALMHRTEAGAKQVQALIEPLLATAGELEQRSSRWTRVRPHDPR